MKKAKSKKDKTKEKLLDKKMYYEEEIHDLKQMRFLTEKDKKKKKTYPKKLRELKIKIKNL